MRFRVASVFKNQRDSRRITVVSQFSDKLVVYVYKTPTSLSYCTVVRWVKRSKLVFRENFHLFIVPRFFFKISFKSSTIWFTILQMNYNSRYGQNFERTGSRCILLNFIKFESLLRCLINELMETVGEKKKTSIKQISTKCPSFETIRTHPSIPIQLLCCRHLRGN